MGIFILWLLFFSIVCLFIPLLWRQLYKAINSVGMNNLLKHKLLFSGLAYLLPLAIIMSINYWGIVSLQQFYSTQQTTQYHFAAMLHPIDSIRTPGSISLYEYAGPLFTNTGLHRLLGAYLLFVAGIFFIRYAIVFYANKFQPLLGMKKILASIGLILLWLMEVSIAYVTLITTVGVIFLNISPVTSYALVMLINLLTLFVGTMAITIGLRTYCVKKKVHRLR